MCERTTYNIVLYIRNIPYLSIDIIFLWSSSPCNEIDVVDYCCNKSRPSNKHKHVYVYVYDPCLCLFISAVRSHFRLDSLLFFSLDYSRLISPQSRLISIIPISWLLWLFFGFSLAFRGFPRSRLLRLCSL